MGILLRWLLPAIGVALATLCTGAEAPSAVAQRRLDLMQAAEQGPGALPALSRGLADESPVVRRTAARLLAGVGAPARETLVAALDNEDAVVRQTALKGLLAIGVDRNAALAKAIQDPDLAVRLLAVHVLANSQPRDDAVASLLQAAMKDTDEGVRRVASRALWPFHRQVIPLRERPDWDHEVEVVHSIDLPKDGWRFATDPMGDGHLQKWHEADFDDSGWQTIAIEQAWEKAGHEYNGIAWYRRSVALPARPEGKINAVEIACDGVDECAWIWVNGTYVGQHDLGTAGWDKPFTLDITDAVRWGGPNQMTVRVLDTAYAGGIWKPVRIEVLR
jgi:hypothetical protein